MNRVFLFLAIVTTLFMLCQWYVCMSVRTYLLARYKPVSRRVAYTVLALLGLTNLVGVRLALEPSTGTGLSTGKQLIAVAFFSYLGIVLMLCLFFLLLSGAVQLLDLKKVVLSWIRAFRKKALSVKVSQKGCFNPSCKMPTGESPECTPEVARFGCKAVEQAPDHSNPPRPASETAPADLTSPSRRTFLQWGAAAGMVAVAGYAGRGLLEAYRPAIVEDFDLRHPALNGMTRAMTLIQITDFHFGMFFGNEELEKLVEHVNELEGDALLITGDIFHSPLTPIESAAPILKKLKQRSLGNFVILGNHDFYAGEWRSVATIRESGLELLRNRWITFDAETTRIHLGGIDDPMDNWVWGTNFPEFSSFAKKTPRGGGIRILLSHRPSVLPLASREGIDFVLSGHIHGGQIIVPVPGTGRGLSLARLASQYTHGWYRMGASRMYLSRGVGLTFIPWRINCPPEISVFHLKPSSDGKISISRADRIIKDC